MVESRRMEVRRRETSSDLSSSDGPEHERREGQGCDRVLMMGIELRTDEDGDGKDVGHGTKTS